MEAKYRITDELDIQENVADVPVQYQGDLNGFSVLATFGFRF
jgi:hypothetical protein